MGKETLEKFTWRIKNFSKLKSKKLFSENFILGGHTWQIVVFPKGKKNANSLSIYLDAADVDKLPSRWSIYAKFNLSLINQFNGQMTQTRETEHLFTARETGRGWRWFMSFDKLHNLSGFIVNDTCIIEAKIWVNQVNCKSDELSELIDFHGLGKIEKNYIPLLEEVCLRYPSLIDCQRKRSRRFIEWAFTALGRVLDFLNTKKVKDMNETDACNQLKTLWEELETFRFDLTWLEPHVQSALSMRGYIEKATQVKKMKESVMNALELERKRLKRKVADVEEVLETTRKDLLKAEKGFMEKDLEARLGY